MTDKIKLKDLPIKMKIAKKHKKTLDILYIVSFIIFLPFVLLAYLNDVLEVITNWAGNSRNSIVNNIFKMIYKKEIIEFEKNN